MADDRTRKLIAALAALLSGTSTYFGAKAEEEERKRRESRDVAQDQRAQEYLDLQRSSIEENQRLRAEDRAERTRSEANTANERMIGQAATLGEARGYSRIHADAPVTIPGRGRLPNGALSVTSENIPLVTGDGQIDLDLQRILSGLRQGGDVSTLSQAAGQADTGRAFNAAVRGAEQERDISGAVARQKALIPGQLELTRGQHEIAEQFEDPPAGPAPIDPAEQELERAGIRARVLAETGLTNQEVIGHLIREFPGHNPLDLAKKALEGVDAARKAVGSGFAAAGSPVPREAQNQRIQKQREWDRLAVEWRKRGVDPEEKLGPRP